MGRPGLAFAGATALILTILAGCASNAPEPSPEPGRDFGPGFRPAAFDANGLPVPEPLCHEAQAGNLSERGCNFDMTPDEGRQGNEVTIAVNPMNPRQIVGGAKDYYPIDAGECVWDGVYVTHDGGRTAFEDRSLDGSPWRLASDPSSFKPNYASQFWCTTDPVAYFSADGQTFYYLAMAYQADRVTGSKSCDQVCEIPEGCASIVYCPRGSLNDWFFNRATQIVGVSIDGGKTFEKFTPVMEGGSYPYMFNDKGWIAASTDGTIHVMWLASLGGGNLYFRSSDGGTTFAHPFVMSDTPTAVSGNAGQGSFVDVGPGAEVYAAWTSDTINLRRSLDTGATWDATQALIAPHPAGMPGLSSRDWRTGFPAMATDRAAASPFANSVYFAFQDSCQEALWHEDCAPSAEVSSLPAAAEGENRANIYVMASHDGGKTFGTPVRVNDDALPNGLADPDNYQIMPAISVSPGGVIDVTWMDTRLKGMADTPDDPTTTGSGVPAGTPHHRMDQYYAYSLDGGQTWSRNVRVRDAADQGWDPLLSHHQNGKVFIGDYIDIDSSWQAAHPVWPDTRDGQAVKVFTATLQRPMFADGWDDDAREAAEQTIREHPL